MCVLSHLPSLEAGQPPHSEAVIGQAKQPFFQGGKVVRLISGQLRHMTRLTIELVLKGPLGQSLISGS